MGDFLVVVVQWDPATEVQRVTSGRFPSAELAWAEELELRRTRTDVVHSVVINVTVPDGE